MFESEEKRIAWRIKDFIKKKEHPEYVYIMLRDGRILDFNDYRNMVKAGRINPQDAYVYIWVGRAFTKTEFYYPYLSASIDLISAYLSKLGFYYAGFDMAWIVPATGFKYIVVVEVYGKYIEGEEYLTVELANLDTVVNNTNLRMITFEVLGEKLISGEKKLTDEEKDKILGIYRSQKLFAGHNFREARDIIDDYYIKDNQSLVKEIARITMDYDRIFHSYRVCYDKKTWEEVDCFSIR